MISEKVVNFYKTGESISFIIAPMCKYVPDPEEPTKQIKKCLPHADTPEELVKMFDAVTAALKINGFELEIFGSPKSMYTSLDKKLGHSVIKEFEDLISDLTLQNKLFKQSEDFYKNFTIGFYTWHQSQPAGTFKETDTISDAYDIYFKTLETKQS